MNIEQAIREVEQALALADETVAEGGPKWVPLKLEREAVRALLDAVRAQRGAIVGGPIEMRDYDYITLARDHMLGEPTAETRLLLPAGSRLYMVKPEPGGLGLTYETGAACKAGDWPHPDSDESKARFAELQAEAIR